MFHRRVVSFLLAVVLLGLLAGCAGTPPGAGELLEGAAPNFDSFTLRLPRIYVQYAEGEGGYAEPAVWGMRASQLESWFGLDLGMLKIPQFYMDWLKASDVQHIELVHDGAGLFAYVNGEAMPYVAWDAESVGLSAELAEGFGVSSGDLMTRLLPMVRHVGLDIVVQMPLQAGAEIIPYRDPASGLMETTAAPEIEEPEAELKLAMAYDDNGVPTVWGMSAEILQPMIGYTPGQIDPQYIAQLKQAGVQRVAVQTLGDGLFFFVNDRPLPNVAWSKEHLTNALDLYAQMNEASWVPNEAFVGMVRELVLQMCNSDILLIIDFP